MSSKTTSVISPKRPLGRAQPKAAEPTVAELQETLKLRDEEINRLKGTVERKQRHLRNADLKVTNLSDRLLDQAAVLENNDRVLKFAGIVIVIMALVIAVAVTVAIVK